MAYYDSLGNRYDKISGKPKTGAKPSKGGKRKIGRDKEKSERYRKRVGKPNGPGQPGNKR